MLRKTLRDRLARRAHRGITAAAEAGLATVMNAAASLLRRRDGIAVVATVSLVAGCGSSSHPSPGPVTEAPAMHQDGGTDSGGVIVEAPAFDSGRPVDSGGVIVEAPQMLDSGAVDSGDSGDSGGVIVEAPQMTDSGGDNG